MPTVTTNQNAIELTFQKVFFLALTERSSVSTIKWLFFIVIVINEPFAFEWLILVAVPPFSCIFVGINASPDAVIDVAETSPLEMKLSLLWLIPLLSHSDDLNCKKEKKICNWKKIF